MLAGVNAPRCLEAAGVRAPKNTLAAATAFLALVVRVNVAIASLLIAAALRFLG
jgi:hypothetical protein